MKTAVMMIGASCAMVFASLRAEAATSTFDASSDGWTAFGDTATPVTFVASGGHPGGFVQVADSVSGGVMYFAAPAKFLGNQAAAYGTDFTFDLMQSYPDAPNQFADLAGDVLLTGGGTTLAFGLPANPTNGAWSSYSVPMLASSWHITDLTGAAPTQTQMQTVLSNLTAVSIRAEYQSGPDTDSLDNVQLVPEPSAFLLLGIAGCGLVSVRRRPGH